MPVISASGETAPPLFVFKGLRLPYRTFLRNGEVRTETSLSKLQCGALAAMREENRGIDTARFMDWGYSFVDYVEPFTQDGRKVLLIYDGYRTHLSSAILELFDRNNIIVYVLPAHTSGKTKPLDVVLFSVFKKRLPKSIRSCAAPVRGKKYDIFDMCSLIRDAYVNSFTVKNIQASFYCSGIWPLDGGKRLNYPRPATTSADARIMSVEELQAAFQEKRKVLRDSIRGADATTTRSGFIDTSHGAVVTSSKALELAREKRDFDLEKLSLFRAREARRATKEDLQFCAAAQHARKYRHERMKRRAELAGKSLEEFALGV